MKERKAKNTPLNIKAPIVLPGDTTALHNFILGLENHTNVEAAEMESERLAPWFQAASNYLTDSLSTANLQNAEEMRGLVTAESLRKIFNAVTVWTRNTILSDVVIAPTGVLGEESLERHFRFVGKYTYRESSMAFGFACAHQGGKVPTKFLRLAKSIVFPVYTLDDGMMETLKQNAQEGLLKNLQAVMTFVNHDMLHHYTNPLLGDILYLHIDERAAKIWKDWHHSLPCDNSSYETWALASHENIWLHPSNASAVDDILQHVKKYFSGLRDLGIALVGSGTPPADAHKTVDFFGTVMLQALARVFPLTHPAMSRAHEWMEWADPAPEETPVDCCKTAMGNDFLTAQSASELLSDNDQLAMNAADRHFAGRDVLRSYIESGFVLFPCDDKEAKPTYAQYKMLQMVAMGGLQAHAPNILYRGQRTKSPDLTLNMIRAAAKTIGLNPTS